jgi:hypothetical protein
MKFWRSKKEVDTNPPDGAALTTLPARRYGLLNLQPMIAPPWRPVNAMRFYNIPIYLYVTFDIQE